jgi:hypothetical protein
MQVSALWKVPDSTGFGVQLKQLANQARTHNPLGYGKFKVGSLCPSV